MARRPDGYVDVRDPRLFSVYTLDASYLDVAAYFDGARSAAEVRSAMRANGARAFDPRRITEVAEELGALFLLDTEEAASAEPVPENAAPHGLLEGTERRLRVLPNVEPDARWSCHACGACCHGLVVEITEEEEQRIDARLYADVLGGEHFAHDAFIDPVEPAKRILRQRKDRNDACVFLSEDGLCLVHARQGMEHKPDACQIFPYMVIHVPDEPPRIALRTNCHSMYRSFRDGASVEEAIPEVRRLTKTHASLRVPSRIPVFRRERSAGQVSRLFSKVASVLEREGGTPAALREIDDKLLKGRARASRRAYGRRLLEYLALEREGRVPVEEGGLSHQLRLVQRPKAALEAMARGKNPPATPEPVAHFLGRQARLALYGFGPLNLPDAGVGLVALMLSLEAALHAVGPRGRLRTANRAFMAFASPLLESTTHAWPLLDAIDPDLAAQLRKPQV